MRHLKAGRKLGRNASHRRAMYRNMVTSLMLHGSIRTTEAKAKELRRIADRLITLGKRVPPSALEGLEGAELEAARARRVHAIRLARRWVTDRHALHMIFDHYAEDFKDRPGGYTRVLKMGHRRGDNAPMSLVSLVMEPMGATPAPADEQGEGATVSSAEGQDEGATAPSAEGQDEGATAPSAEGQDEGATAPSAEAEPAPTA